MKNTGGFLSVLLLSCSGTTFTGLDADPVDAAADVDVGDSATDTRTDVVDDDRAEYKDAPGLEADAPTCGSDGGSCMAGTCCAALHCNAGACTSCKPDGILAISSSECCNPSGFANAVCGGVKTCAAPNYDKCGPSNNGLACCGGATCKQNGNVWACTCGPTDAPCHTGNDFECCSSSCVAGWCK